MSRLISDFAIVPDDGLYRLQFKLETGDIVEVAASFDQLDLIAEEIDRRLDADED